jgi:hypothetical protein
VPFLAMARRENAASDLIKEEDEEKRAAS